MGKFVEMPSATAVMELLADRKKVSVKDLVFDFIDLEQMKPLVDLKKQEKLVVDNSLGSIILPFEHKQYCCYDRVDSNLKNNAKVHNLSVVVDDFNLNINLLVNINNELRTIHRDFSKPWRKMLFKFDKDYMFSEFSEITEYQKQKALEKFYEKFNQLKIKTDEKTL